jgi:hypothetical protein
MTCHWERRQSGRDKRADGLTDDESSGQLNDVAVIIIMAIITRIICNGAQLCGR